MTVAETSREAYSKLDKQQVASEKQQIRNVLKPIAPFALTDKQISRRTGLARNIVWSRRASMVKKGEVVADKVVHDSITGMDAQSWRYNQQ